jgi:hypothetical protein
MTANIFTHERLSYFALSTHWECSGMSDGSVYLRDLDSSTYPFKYDSTDTEDPTSLDDTISINVLGAGGMGIITPVDCELVKVSHQFVEVGNVDGDVDIMTFKMDPTHAGIGAHTFTLKVLDSINSSSMGTAINRKSFSVVTTPDTSVSQAWDAGDLVVLGFYSNDASVGNPSLDGTTTWLFKITGTV